jgi:hypothetical protein
MLIRHSEFPTKVGDILRHDLSFLHDSTRLLPLHLLRKGTALLLSLTTHAFSLLFDLLQIHDPWWRIDNDRAYFR